MLDVCVCLYFFILCINVTAKHRKRVFCTSSPLIFFIRLLFILFVVILSFSYNVYLFIYLFFLFFLFVTLTFCCFHLYLQYFIVLRRVTQRTSPATIIFFSFIDFLNLSISHDDKMRQTAFIFNFNFSVFFFFLFFYFNER